MKIQFLYMLMKKLPNEGFKRQRTDVAGDMICSKGHVDLIDFLTFIQKRADRLNNRFRQGFKSPLLQQKKERRYGDRSCREKHDPPFRAATLTTRNS